MRNAKGFTLIELLIVIAIIAILAAVLIPNVLNARKRSQETAAQSFARQVATWIAAADTAATTATQQAALQAVTDCTDPLLKAEGAPDTLPSSLAPAPGGCVISFDPTLQRYTVTTTAQTGKSFTATY